MHACQSMPLVIVSVAWHLQVSRTFVTDKALRRELLRCAAFAFYICMQLILVLYVFCALFFFTEGWLVGAGVAVHFIGYEMVSIFFILLDIVDTRRDP